jgi:hypothetical protein
MRRCREATACFLCCAVRVDHILNAQKAAMHKLISGAVAQQAHPNLRMTSPSMTMSKILRNMVEGRKTD